MGLSNPHGGEPRHTSHGLHIVTPVAMKLATLRVTTIIPCTRAVAAINAQHIHHVKSAGRESISMRGGSASMSSTPGIASASAMVRRCCVSL
jgi:hypothetical protein